MKQVESAGIVIFTYINKHINYLILHYPHGHWDFPKGHIEPGETKEHAALRELKEETGFDAQIIPGFSHTFDYMFRNIDGQLTQKIVTFLVGKTEQKNFTLSYEHIGAEWLPFNQAVERLTYENAKKLIQKVDHFVQSIPGC